MCLVVGEMLMNLGGMGFGCCGDLIEMRRIEIEFGRDR